jgi:cAMP-dependent protein kinase regulator
MTLCGVKEGETIFAQNTIGQFFYIIKRGIVELSINDVRIKNMEEGQSFGEFALLHQVPRSGTVKAVTECYFWVLEHKSFKKIVNHINNLNYEENKKFIQNFPVFANIEADTKTVLSASLIKEVHEPGDVIIKDGEISNSLYLLREGEADCVSKNITLRKLKKGDHFGERGVLLEAPRSMEVIAKTKCICYSLSSETLKNILGEDFRDAIFLNFIKNAFANSKYFKKLNLKLIDHAYECFRAISYNFADVAFSREHQMNSMLTIVVEGNFLNVRKK